MSANYGIGGLTADYDVITDIIESVDRYMIVETEEVHNGFVHHIDVSSSERREILELLEDAMDRGEIIVYSQHDHDYRGNRY